MLRFAHRLSGRSATAAFGRRTCYAVTKVAQKPVKYNAVASCASIFATGALVGSMVSLGKWEEETLKFSVAVCDNGASPSATEQSSSSYVPDDQETFINVLEDCIADNNRVLDRKRLNIKMDEWLKYIDQVEAILSKEDDEDDEDDEDQDSKQSNDLPPSPTNATATAVAPLIDEHTNLSLEILYVRDQQNRLLGAEFFGHNAQDGHCKFRINPNETGLVRVFAIYRDPRGKGRERLYFSTPIPIPSVPKAEDDDDDADDEKWVRCA